MGNHDGSLALRQARSVLADLTAEWPDVHIVQRTLPAARGSDANRALLEALEGGSIAVAVQPMETLPFELPEGIAIAAVARRLEPRFALITKGIRTVEELAGAGHVGVYSRRDRDFLKVVRPDVEADVLGGNLDDDLARLTKDELEALIVPGGVAQVFERRQRVDAHLEPEVFPPAPAQSALALLVREEDDLAFEVAYTLQHRPSMDRVVAERAFARGVADAGEGVLVGALATVTSDGDLTLFGVAAKNGSLVQATVSGEAREGADLGAELASDVKEQLAAL